MKKILKYQLIDLAKALSIYFLVITLVMGISAFSIVLNPDMTLQVTGTQFSNIILSFVISICIYKEHYLLAMQNGISRKTFYKSCFCSTIIFSLSCTLFDFIITHIIGALTSTFPSFGIIDNVQLLYSGFFEKSGKFTALIANYGFSFISTMMIFTLGILIAAIFCRMPKKFRTIFVIALPVSVCCVLPMTFVLFPSFWEKIGTILITLMGLTPGAENPFIGSVSLTVVFIILAGCNYGLLRKTEV